MKCSNCGKEIKEIETNFFNRDGSDSFEKVEINEVAEVDGVSMIVDSNWCGADLTEEEQKEIMLCPFCKEYPFDKNKEIDIYEQLVVVCFKKKEEV